MHVNTHIIVSCEENVQDGGERGTDDLCNCDHCLLEGLVVCCTTVPVPDSDAAGQHTLYGSSVNVVRMGGERLALFTRGRKCRCCCVFLESDVVLVVQVRSFVMCTSRNLVLRTLSTFQLSMVSVIRKHDDVVGAELGSAVLGQQPEEQRAEHTALWGTCAQCGSA